jgi:CRP-like cAMP-binding protein
VEVIQEYVTEDPKRLRICSAGDAIGEIGLLTQARRTATVRCLTAVDVLVVDREDFLAIAASYMPFKADLDARLERYGINPPRHCRDEPALADHGGARHARGD